MHIHIKGMVCNHCITAVREAFADAGIPGAEISLGLAIVPGTELTPEQTAALDSALCKRGFERITDQDTRLVEQTRLAIMEHVRSGECRSNLSACLQRRLGMEYSAISKLFSAREGRTIEKYAIAQRIEYAKELLSYGELNVSEVADKTGYSSTAHFSQQFKAVTGLTPTQYLASEMKRTPLNLI